MSARVEVFDGRLCELGEGPMWDERTGEVFWVDIMSSAVHARHLYSGEVRTIGTPAIVGAVLPHRGAGSGWLVALEHGPALLGEDGEVTLFQTFTEADGAAPEIAVRANDAKCDPRGRCFVGTMAHGADPGCGSLYRLDPGRTTLERVLENVTISNGTAWSADERTMYYVDSMTHRVDAFDYDADTGAISARRPVVEFAADAGLPDGMTIDADGCLWVAFWGGGAVRRFTPGGDLDRTIELPSPQVTSCAFVGPQLDRLVITTARLGLSPGDSVSGSTFIVEPGVTGTPTASFGG